MDLPSNEATRFTTFHVLQKIHSFDFPHELINPDSFVGLIRSSLHLEVQCLNSRGNHIFSSNCNKRLETLSAILACFSFIDKKSLQDKCLPRDNMTTRMDATSSEIKQSMNIYDDNLKHRVHQGPCDSVLPKQKETLKSLESWYLKTCDKFADEEFLLKLLRLQENSQCMFAHHIIKKTVCLCTEQYDKMAIILSYLEDKWKRTQIVNGHELDLIDALMSMKQNEEEKRIRKQVFYWFFDSKSVSPMSAMLEKLSTMEKENFREKMSWFSVLGKLLKYCVSSGQTIPRALGDILVGILEKNEVIFFSHAKSDHVKQQFLLLKFLKLFNKLVTVQFCIGRAKPSDIILKCCEKILQHSPSLFEMCTAHGYMRTITFWGEKNPRQSSSQHSHLPNVVMARRIFLLAVKAGAVLVLGHDLKDDLVPFQSVWKCIHDWMWQVVKDKCAASDWIPLLLGDQDDKWIEALLCLLFIYKERAQTSINEEQRSACSHECDEKTSSNCHIHKMCVNCTYSQDFWGALCPHRLFLQFMEFIFFDPIVVSDFLMSPETNFLEYFTEYLSYLEINWDGFVSYCSKEKRCKKGNSNVTSSHCMFQTKSISKAEAVPSNHGEDVRMGRVSLLQSHTDLEMSYPSSKFIKTSRAACPLVNYDNTDSSSSDEDREESNTILSDSKDSGTGSKFQLVQSENGFACEEIHSVIAGDGNDVNKISKRIESNGESIVLKTKEPHFSNLVTRNPPLSSFLSTSSESSSFSSSSSLSDEEEDAILDENENESERQYDISKGKVVTESQDENNNMLEAVMTMLIRLRFHIQRLSKHQLFPYNTDFLLKLLSSCEEKYESM